MFLLISFQDLLLACNGLCSGQLVASIQGTTVALVIHLVRLALMTSILQVNEQVGIAMSGISKIFVGELVETGTHYRCTLV